MVDLSNEEARSLYEMSKLTSTTNFIMTDFISTVALALFKSYISNFTDYKVALQLFMNEWEEKIIKAKEEEVQILLDQQDSMADMLVGSTLAEASNLEAFKQEVTESKERIIEAIVNSIEE